MEACLAEIMGIQESIQKRGHACLIETGDTRRHTEKGACMSNRDRRHTRRHTKMGHACLTETIGIQEGIQKRWGRCMSNRDCRHTRMHTKIGECLTKTVGRQKSIQKRLVGGGGLHV